MRALIFDREPFARERLARWVCIALCLGLFGAYLHALAGPPLWWDEGSSIYKALLPPATLVRLVAVSDDHPPGYYLLLRGWMLFFGPSPFGTRLLGVFAAACLAPLLYVVGRRLDRKGWTGLLAMIIGALLPYVVQHAREVRMYAVEMALAAASMYAFLRLLAVPAKPRRWWVAYLGVTIAGLYLHYAFALLCAAQGVAVLAAWRQKKARLTPWLVAAGVAAVAYLPWLSTTWPRLQGLLTGHLAGAQGPRFDWPSLLPALQQNFMSDWPAAWSTLVLSVLALAAITGGAALFRRQTVAALCLAVSLAEAVLLMALLQRPGVNGALLAARQTYFSVPALAWLAAYGLRVPAKRARWVGLAAGGFIVFSLSWNLPIFYRIPANPAEDYRSLVAQAAALYRPGDAVWTNYDWQEGYFDGYVPHLPFAFYPGLEPSATVTATLESIFTRHPRLWVVTYKVDVHDLVNYPFNAWLHAHALLAFESWYGNSYLALFEPTPAPPSAWPAQTKFEDGLTLEYVPAASGSRPGDLLTLSLRWQASAPPPRSYSVFIHVRKPDAPPVAQNDYSLQALEPSGVLAQGQPVFDPRTVLLPPDLASGAYSIYVGLYDPQAPNDRLKVVSPAGCDLPDSACLGTVDISGAGGQP